MYVRIEEELLLILSTPMSPCFLNIMHVFVLLSVHRIYHRVFTCGFHIKKKDKIHISNSKWIVSFCIPSIYCSVYPKINFFFCNS